MALSDSSYLHYTYTTLFSMIQFLGNELNVVLEKLE